MREEVGARHKVKASAATAMAGVDIEWDHGDEERSRTGATTEGIKFAVWTEKAYRGEPRWSAYYYLDAETTPTCP